MNPLLSVQHIRELKVNNQIEFWIDLFKNYIPKDINILLENEYDDTPEDIGKIVRTVNKENFGICLIQVIALPILAMVLRTGLRHR